MCVYGYTRKGYPVPLIKQLEAVQGYACDEIFVENSNLREEKELIRLLEEKIAVGDTLVVADIRTLGKNVKSLISIMRPLKEKGVRLISVFDEIDTEKENFCFYAIVSLLAEMDYSYHANLTQKGLNAAKEQGIKGGRPKISNATIKKIIMLHEEEGYTFRKIADMCSVSVGTVHKYLKVQDEKAETC